VQVMSENNHFGLQEILSEHCNDIGWMQVGVHDTDSVPVTKNYQRKKAANKGNWKRSGF
jgi:hypothetical protein